VSGLTRPGRQHPCRFHPQSTHTINPPMAAARTSSLNEGLRRLGLNADTDNSVFFSWSRAFGSSNFDAFRSIVPAPDHVFMLGITRRLIKALFATLSNNQRVSVSTSMRDALALSGLRRTRPYNFNSKDVHSLLIYEWAAVLKICIVAIKRSIPWPETSPAAVPRPPPLTLRLGSLEKFQLLMCKTYFSPRVELDGGDACRAAANLEELQRLATDFLSSVDAVCRRADCSGIKSMLDVPNLHRVREIYFFSVPWFLHIKHTRELHFEAAHQHLKKAALSGNGHDDARRAMYRMRDEETLSRLVLAPTKFRVAPEWLRHAGIRKAAAEALPLWSQGASQWTMGGRCLTADSVPHQAVALAAHLCADGFEPSWRSAVTRRDAHPAKVGDCLGILCAGLQYAHRLLPVAVGYAARARGCKVEFFRLRALFLSSLGQPMAVVNPFRVTGEGVHAVEESRFLAVVMGSAVRRALAVHACQLECPVNEHEQLDHTDDNRWILLGRADMYPAVSG